MEPVAPERPVELVPPQPSELIVSDESAAEELALRTGLDLRSAQTNRALKKVFREESIQDHLHRLIVIGLYVVAVAALIMFVMLVLSYVTPWQPLTAEQLNSIKQLLFSGSLGAGLSGLARKHLGLGEKEPDN